jgi:hypothetical protein
VKQNRGRFNGRTRQDAVPVNMGYHDGDARPHDFDEICGQLSWSRNFLQSATPCFLVNTFNSPEKLTNPKLR